MTRLLVSVRNAIEAVDALEGGAALIDVKDPGKGPLGMASPIVIDDVIRAVSGVVPVSAALGEAREEKMLPLTLVKQLAFVKFGTASGRDIWQTTFFRTRLYLQDTRCQVVAAAYADWQRACAPSPVEVCRFACEQAAGAFLLDTWCKDGSTLLDWLTVAEIDELCGLCRDAGVPIALAGSLGRPQVQEVLPLRPDWIAVRGAVCTRGERINHVERGLVRALVDVIEDVKASLRVS